MAMGITLAQNEVDLLGNELFIEDRGIEPAAIAWSKRIGIRVGIERPWRVYLENCHAVSGITKALPQRTRRTRRNT